jgi:hypothetical protein
MTTGFYKRRRGILEHLEAGTINLIDLAIHDYLNLHANLVIGSQSSIPPGVCITSAAAIYAVCGGQISYKTIQRRLRHLEKIGWIKRFNVPGKRGNYPVLICRASVHRLSGREYRISGEQTVDWRDPKYVPVLESFSNSDSSDPSVSTLRELRAERGKKSNHAAKPAPPPDARFQRFFAFAFESFLAKHGRMPLWGGKDRNGLKNLLKGQSAESLPLERLQVLWRSFLASTEAFTAKQGDSLAYFCSNLDKFSDGPILAAPGKGVTNGKPTAPDLAIRNAKALGLN